MADITFKSRGRVQSDQDPENLTEEERMKHRLEWQQKHPFAPDSAMPGWMRQQGSQGGASASSGATNSRPWEASPLDLNEPSPYVMAALAKPADQRSLQEKEAIRIRRGVEQQTMTAGGRIKGGITPGLIASEKAAEQGRFDATAGLAYNQAKNGVLAQAGFAADGTPLPAGQPAAPAAPRPTSGGTMTRNGVETVVPGSPAQPVPAAQKPTGFAMRTMPDGTVKTASGVDARGSSIVRSFDTKEEALALFRPAQPAAPAAGGPQLAAPAPAVPAAQPQAVKSAAPSPTIMPSGMPIASPETEKTTSPTTRFEMTNRTMGTPMMRGAQVMAEKLNPFSTSFRF